MANIKNSVPSIPARILTVIDKIAKVCHRNISIGKLGPNFKIYLNFSNEVILNYDHKSFQQLISSSDSTPDEVLEIYLLGIMSNDITIIFK